MSEINSTLFLKHVPLFASIEEKHLEAIQELTVIRDFKKNSFVVTQGDDSQSLYLVLSGHLKVFYSDENGKEIIHKFLDQWDYFGELALFDPAPRSASVCTLENSQLAILPAKELMAYFTEYPQLALSVLPQLAHRMRLLSEHISKLALLDTYGRVAYILQDQANEENGELITPKLTHQDIASSVGASREMISKILKELKVGEYIDIVNKRIIIKRKLPKYW